MNNKSELFDDAALSILDKHSILIKKELSESFCANFEPQKDCGKIFECLWENWSMDEIPDLGSKIISVFNGTINQGDLRLWDYDVLEFIIDLSNTFKLALPKAVINGLPEQLILLVNSDLIR